MVDRYRVWLGAGVLAGGVSAAMLASAGFAHAEGAGASDAQASAEGAPDGDGISSGDRRVSRAEAASKPAGSDNSEEADSSRASLRDDPDSDRGEEVRPVKEIRNNIDAAGTAPPRQSGTDPQSDRTKELPENLDPAPEIDTSGEPKHTGGSHRAAEPDAVVEPAAAEADRERITASPGQTTVAATHTQPASSNFVDNVETDIGSTGGSVVMRLAAAEMPVMTSSKPNFLDVLNSIGTAIYDFYSTAVQVLGGPVRAPFGSSVRVESSTLSIGDGRSVRADWYFPAGGSPTGLIYFQHGLWATASFYSATAAYLAEKTNSIVVAPTLTWNPFDISNYPLQAPGTGRVIAGLFTGDRAELNASARAAGYDKALPAKYVLAGHSAGGGLAVTVARYVSEAGEPRGLAGVVLLDGVRTGNSMSWDLAKIPRSVPVYNLAASPNGWNYRGDANRRLAQVRPGTFTGVTIKGGKHSDAMQSASLGLQFLTYSVIGFSSSWYVTANRVITAGWISDLFAGTHVGGTYGTKGMTIDILSGRWRHRFV